MSPKERYMFNFVNLYKNTTYQYSFHTDVTIKYFNDFMINDLSTFLEPNNTIEILEFNENTNVAQPINIENIEQIPKMNYDETCILSEIFGNRWKKTTFYIRLTPKQNKQI